jgi:hypothetical protein
LKILKKIFEILILFLQMLVDIKFDYKFQGDPNYTHFDFTITIFETYVLRNRRRNGEYVSNFIRAKTGLSPKKRISKNLRNKMYECLDDVFSSIENEDDRLSDSEEGVLTTLLDCRVSGVQLHRSTVRLLHTKA